MSFSPTAAAPSPSSTAALRGRSVKERVYDFADVVMDRTIGRYQTVQLADPRRMPDFLAACRRDVAEMILAERGSWSAAAARGGPSEGGADGTDDDAEEEPMAQAQRQIEEQQSLIEAMGDQLGIRESKELAFRSIASDVIRDNTRQLHQLEVLRGVIGKRDAMLNDQRKNYFRELLHLREIIRQWQTRGGCSLGDAVMQNWNQDDLARSIAEEQMAQMEAIRTEERAQAQRDLESCEAKGAKIQEELRLRIAQLEARIIAMTVAVTRHDVDVQVEGSDFGPVPTYGGEVHPSAKVDAAAMTVMTAADIRLLEESPLHSPPEDTTPPVSGGRKHRQGGGSARHSPRQPTDGPQQIIIEDRAADAQLQSDMATLRRELTKQRDQLTALRKEMERKDTELATAERRRLEDTGKLRQLEAHWKHRLQQELLEKEKLLDAKRKELTQLQEETGRWFNQYRATLPSDQAPVNYATLRRMNQAVENAEEMESTYRLLSWEMVVRDLRRRQVLEDLHLESEAAEVTRDIPRLRKLQLLMDSVAHALWDRCQRLKQQRMLARAEANRLWDVVLYLARSVMHASDPVGPPPRYYSGTSPDSGSLDDPFTSPQLPGSRMSRMSRPQQLRQIMLMYSAKRLDEAHEGLIPTRGPLAAASHAVPSSLQSPRGIVLASALSGGVPAESPQRRGGGGGAAALGTAVVISRPPSAPTLPRNRVAGSAVTRPGSATAAHSSPFLTAAVAGAEQGAPKTALVASAALANIFSPAKLRHLNPQQRRGELLKLMRCDQDQLHISRQKHVDDIYKSRMNRGLPPQTLDSGLHMQRLLGRCESTAGE